jgi:hypothetical protein
MDRLVHISRGDPGWSRVLLVEGVPGVGKSTLLDALLRRHVDGRPPRQVRTLLHLTQAHTYGPLAPDEDRGTLTAASALAHLERVVGMLEWHVRALTAEQTPKLFALVDTLHLTQCRRPGVLGWADVGPLDARLAVLGCRLVFLRASPSVLRARAVEARAGTQFIREYAAPRWGASLDAIQHGLLDEQAAMEAHLAGTRLEHRVLDAGAPLSALVEAAHRFWVERP